MTGSCTGDEVKFFSEALNSLVLSVLLAYNERYMSYTNIF